MRQAERYHLGLFKGLTFVKKTIKVNVEKTTGSFFERKVFTVSITQTMLPNRLNDWYYEEMTSHQMVRGTYPSTYPTIDITAEDRVYLSLAANHASASGNISTNHS